MIHNPWLNRAAVIVALLCVYAAGYASGKDQAIQAHYNHPACHAPLRP
jgi:hypothetical protein